MRYILLVLFTLIATFASAQVQFLGSPTTTVRNRGNFVSDSLFYLPKRTKAPSDTGAIRYQISDSALYVWTGSAWRTAGTAGSAITGSGVAGYMPEFTTATNIDTTRLYHSNGRFAIGSTTTTNGVFNVYSGQSYMDSSLKIGNGELIVGSTSSASRKLYVTSNSDVARFEQTASDKNMVLELRHTNPNASGTIREEGINFLAPNTSARGRITFYPSDTFNVRNYFAFFTPSGSGSNAERMRITNDGNIGIGTTSPSSLLEVNATSPRIRVVGTTGGAVNQYVTDAGQMFVGIDNSSASLFGNGAYSRVIYGGAAYPLDFYTNDLIRARIKSDGELLIGTTTDAGAYALQVAGSIYNTNDAYFGVSSGRLGVGTSTGAGKMSSIQTGVVSPTNSAYWLSHDVSASSTDGLAIGTNGAASYKWIQSYNGALSINSVGNDVLIGTTTDAGAYALQVAGSIYNTTGAVLAASSGNVGIGTASPSSVLHMNGGTGLAHFRITEATTLRGFLGAANGIISGYSNELALRSESGLILSGSGNAVNAYINSSAGELIIANGNTDAGDYKLQVAGNIYNTGNITTGAPTGGTATAWRLGEVATVSPTSPNRTIRVEIGSTVYYIHAKTTND